MKVTHLFLALFSLGLISVSCGKKKKGENKPPMEQHKDAPHDGHGHGHDHGEEGHDH